VARLALLETIVADRMRYPTLGDWIPVSGEAEWIIQVAEMPREYAFLLALHELVEAYYCYRQGIPEEIVTHWDVHHPHTDDPGSLPGCPYGEAHLAASLVERLAAQVLGIDWDRYDDYLTDLWEKTWGRRKASEASGPPSGHRPPGAGTSPWSSRERAPGDASQSPEEHPS
jgi:hypothetical protein